MHASLQGLERDLCPMLGVTTLVEPLVQLMCHGVPVQLKAASDRCVYFFNFLD